MGLRRDRWMRSMALIGSAVCASAFAWGQVHSSTERWPIARSTPPVTRSNQATAPGGRQFRFEAALVPDAVLAARGREKIEYHGELTSRLNEGGAVAWTAVVVDDVGNVVSTLGTGQTPVQAHSVASTASFVPDLPDGYYSLRIRAAVHSVGWDDVTEAVQYFTVAQGKMREMSYDDWHTYSRDGLAVQLAAAPPQHPQNGGAR